MIALGFLVLAGLGAIVRGFARRYDEPLGLGTLAVNLVGAFLLGWLVGGDHATGVVTDVGTGGLGALTTWSTVAVETVSATGGTRARLARGVLDIGTPIAAAAAGLALGTG